MDLKSIKPKVYLPIAFSLVLAFGVLIGSRLNPSFMRPPVFSGKVGQFNKLNEVINYIQQEYVDTINEKTLVDESINAILDHLDPHSAYIPAEDLQAANEPLEGNFDGIGVEFHLQDDTIMVVTPISGGPSEAVGIMPGDRIIKVDGKNVAGINISSNDVMQKIRGGSGSKVKLTILRKGKSKMMDFVVTRGKIPIYSVDISYMVDDVTGYIKISRFAATTYDEYKAAFAKLKMQGLKNLVLDLRGNPGGYVSTATKLADEFLGNKKLIVYTEGKARQKESYFATSKGDFEQGNLAVLVDEGSASASEILSGALQDLDRATIIGRRSFGKGLVQEQSVFPDGSGLRLTIARYYTPTGRCIQKSYSEGIEKYQEDIQRRLKNGELENADSIKFPDSLKYRTPAGKIVFGGGGIMPDIFVPLDTTGSSNYLTEIYNKGLINQYSFEYVDENRARFKQYKDFKEFNKSFFITDEILNHFVNFAQKAGVKRDNGGLKLSSSVLRIQLKAFIARQVWKNEGLYPVLHSVDKALKKAIETVEKS